MARGREHEFILRPVGVVRSPVADAKDMPVEGVAASAEVFPEYAEGLLGIEANTHLIILGWFHQADRDSLSVARRGAAPRGVFGLRAPGRPNPIGLCTARVTGIEGALLHLDRLDMVDGTPIADIKRYSPGWDSVFSARTSRDLYYPRGRDPASFLRDMLVEAVNFHGESCAGAALGVRIVGHAMDTWRVGKKDPGLSVGWGPDGCIDDALQGITGATIGNGRLRPGAGPAYTMSCNGRDITFSPRDITPETIARILDADIHQLFEVCGCPG